MKWPSPALVVALIALFVALGGTGYAVTKLPANSVGTKQIKKNAVTGVKVKDGSLSASDFAAGTLLTGPQGPAGPRGETGATGSQGARGATGPAGPVEATYANGTPFFDLNVNGTASTVFTVVNTGGAPLTVTAGQQIHVQALMVMTRPSASSATGTARAMCFASVGPVGGTFTDISNYEYKLIPPWSGAGTPVTYDQLIVIAGDTVTQSGDFDIAIKCAQGNGDPPVQVRSVAVTAFAADQ